MDAVRQEQHRMGNNMPKGAQLIEQEPFPSGVSNILRSAANMLGWSIGASHLTEIRQERETEQGDRMRRIWGEFGQGDRPGRKVDIPPHRHQPLDAQDLQAVGYVQRHGGGELLHSEA